MHFHSVTIVEAVISRILNVLLKIGYGNRHAYAK
jgi:hypothetical protein